MKLARIGIAVFAASAGVIFGLGLIGVLMTPPELRPSAIRRQERLTSRDLWRPAAHEWDAATSR